MRRLQQDPNRGNPHREETRRKILRRTGADHFGMASMIALLAISLVLFTRLMSSGFLATKYLILVMLFLIVVNSFHVMVQFPTRRNKLGKLACGVIAVVLSASMIWAMVGVGSVQAALARITGKMTETDVIAVAVRAEDPAQDLADTVGYTFGYDETLDRDNTEAMLRHLGEALGEFPTSASEGMPRLIGELYNGAVDAIIVNTGFLSLLENGQDFTDFRTRTRIIYEHSITREVEVSPAQSSVKKSFVVYCSGIDSRSSDISSPGNSDVNILAVVNPETHQVLLLNTPRDYYVPLHMNGQSDKLTHAGNYGIDESMKTLDDLYGITTSYYVRVNFNGLVNIVDAVGGVDVESPKSFTTGYMQVPNESGSGLYYRSFSFPAGPVHLDGREALAFSRERDAFAGGDNQRGKNQMTVIKGIVEKATSPAILSNYKSLLAAVADACITNISYDEVTRLVQAQQRNPQGWNVTSYAVSGAGGSDYCYSWPGQPLYVTRPDYSTVDTAKELIRQVMEGETPVLPE